MVFDTVKIFLSPPTIKILFTALQSEGVIQKLTIIKIFRILRVFFFHEFFSTHYSIFMPYFDRISAETFIQRKLLNVRKILV